MAKANFYLKSNPERIGESLIYLFFSYESVRLKYSTGQTIDSKHWNKTDQRAKKSLLGFKTLNDYLQKLEQTVFDIYRRASTNGVNPTLSHIRNELNIFLSKNEEKKEKDFVNYFEEFIEVKNAVLQPRTIKKYHTLLSTLKSFAKKIGMELSYSNMDVKLYDGYIAYRVTMGKSDETIFKEIAVLKTFLHWSVDREYNTNTKFIKQFKTFEKVKDVLSLTEEELFTIFKLPLTNKVHLQVRDMFCFACFTGLRYSDVLQVSPNKIIDSTLTLNQIKTTDKVTVQLVKFAVEILERNDYRFPQFSNFYVNKVLRKIAAEAKFERITSKLMISGKNRREEEKPLKNAISFHIGRKTYVTLSLKRGVRHEIVMSQTGHKDLKTLQKYIAVSNAMIAEELSQAWDKEPVKSGI